MPPKRRILPKMQPGYVEEKPSTSKKAIKKTGTKDIAPGKKLPDGNAIRGLDDIKRYEDKDLSDVLNQDPDSGVMGGFRQRVQNMWNAIIRGWRYVGARIGIPVHDANQFEDDPDKEKSSVKIEDEDDDDDDEYVDIEERRRRRLEMIQNQLERPGEINKYDRDLVMFRPGEFL